MTLLSMHKQNHARAGFEASYLSAKAKTLAHITSWASTRVHGLGLTQFASHV